MRNNNRAAPVPLLTHLCGFRLPCLCSGLDGKDTEACNRQWKLSQGSRPRRVSVRTVSSRFRPRLCSRMDRSGCTRPARRMGTFRRCCRPMPAIITSRRPRQSPGAVAAAFPAAHRL
jgi:hypothetical protein